MTNGFQHSFQSVQSNKEVRSLSFVTFYQILPDAQFATLGRLGARLGAGLGAR
jgi:hypothetical protein